MFTGNYISDTCNFIRLGRKLKFVFILLMHKVVYSGEKNSGMVLN